MKLTMAHFLSVVAQESYMARDVLLDEGYHPSVIYAKAEKASRKGYTDYGTVADRPWLTPEGERFLEEHGDDG